jgi:hypothetical protein
MNSRPAEVFQSSTGAFLGALLIIAGVFTDTSKITPEVTGALVLIVSQIAAGVTWFVKQKQHAGQLASGAAGEVVKTGG